MPPQVLGSGHENQPASATAEMGHNKIAGQHDWLQEFEASLSKGPDLNVKANEQFKSVSLPSPPADMLPVSEIRKQPFGDDLKLNQPVHDGVKSPCSLMEKQDSPKVAGSSEPAMKIISGDDSSHLNAFHHCCSGEKLFPSPQKNAAEGFSLQRVIEPQSDVPSGATNIMKAGVDISAMTSLPATLFGREAVLPESKAAADEPVLPKMTEPQPCNSPDVTSNVDCNIKDVIPPAES
ncbi:AT HOOK MOTIF-CONTAINING PROTEIN [Salix purpurea]|uniref:AT HOOK MOTIF-CONTAINING PROTEIN n=1 Tax=Salix purpurea TaxID=77065 RepID=A0A9Q0WHI8_SALPP|nr:AT HOOK MOTIF-CONTAINING PROTEIN [Salix purpurea]